MRNGGSMTGPAVSNCQPADIYLEHDIGLENLLIADAGNLELHHPDHSCNHALIREQLGQQLRRYPRVIVLGGSHDGTYSTVRGLFDANDG